MDVTQNKNHFLKYGYVKLKSVLDQSELQLLKTESIKLMNKPPIPWSEYYNYKYSPEGGKVCFSDLKNMTVYTDITGQSSKVDALLEKIMTNSSVKNLLTETIGPGYKLWTASIRKAEPGGEGMPLHQDSLAEVVFSILLEDTPDLFGTTVVIPRSHKWPLSVRESVLDRLPQKLMKPLLGGATGSCGDMTLFFGRTYHGRYPHNSKGNLCIMLSIFAVGGRYYVQKTPKTELENMGPELSRLLDPNMNLKYLDDGRVEVLPNSDYESFVSDRALNRVLKGRGHLSVLSPWRAIQLTALFLRPKQMKSWFLYHWNSLFSKNHCGKQCE